MVWSASTETTAHRSVYEVRAAAIETVSELAGGSSTTGGGDRRAAQRERLTVLGYVYTAIRCECVYVR